MVKGERKQAREDAGRDYFVKETSYGTFRRSLTLPESIEPDKVNAKYVNGILEITIPTKASLAAKSIPIAVEGGDQKVIETKAA